MKAYVITIENSISSNKAADALIKSSKKVGNTFKIEKWPASTPGTIDEYIENHKLFWNWPWIGKELCTKTGLFKSAYVTKDPNRRIACFISHYKLWNFCAYFCAPCLILEHDALFIKKLPNNIWFSKYEILGLNDPRGATRRSQIFYDEIQRQKDQFQDVPIVDSLNVPQGLAGNSTYILQPTAAIKLITATHNYGMWPNDALMCQQLFPGLLGVTKTFYTKVQKLKSTTTL